MTPTTLTLVREGTLTIRCSVIGQPGLLIFWKEVNTVIRNSSIYQSGVEIVGNSSVNGLTTKTLRIVLNATYVSNSFSCKLTDVKQGLAVCEQSHSCSAYYLPSISSHKTKTFKIVVTGIKGENFCFVFVHSPLQPIDTP